MFFGTNNPKLCIFVHPWAQDFCWKWTNRNLNLLFCCWYSSFRMQSADAIFYCVNKSKLVAEDWTCGSKLSCGPEIGILQYCTFTNCATCFKAAPYTTRCSCIRVDFQNASFLPLKTRTNSSIMCTSRDSWGKTIETLLLFSLKSPIPRIGILCKKISDPLCEDVQ